MHIVHLAKLSWPHCCRLTNEGFGLRAMLTGGLSYLVATCKFAVPVGLSLMHHVRQIRVDNLKCLYSFAVTPIFFAYPCYDTLT